jgi:hypothetical protein
MSRARDLRRRARESAADQARLQRPANAMRMRELRSARGLVVAWSGIPREKGRILWEEGQIPLESGAIQCLLFLAHKGPISSNPCVIRERSSA